MATGGVFTLITNDGKQDKLLQATDLLNSRIASIKAQNNGENPALSDIEVTHVLFTNAHFKPFVAIGYEYHKTTTTAGTPQLGSKIQFSIPQFGDFFADMVLHITLSVPTLTGTFTSGTNNANHPIYRYCEYPGERILQYVGFEVNGNILDEYDSDVPVIHRQFLVQPNKKLGWDRCMGQESPADGYWMQVNDTAADNYRGPTKVATGYQTFMTSHDALDLYVPLLFWYNKDVRCSIPSAAIPYGQRFIDVTLASASQLLAVVGRGTSATDAAISTPSVATCDLYINNIFVNPEIHDIYIDRVGFNLIRVYREQHTAVNKNDDNILLQQLKWPIEHMFVGIRPSENTTMAIAKSGEIPKHGGQLDFWHRFTKVTNSLLSDFAGNAGSVSYNSYAQTIDSVTIQAHGVSIWDQIPSQMFNSYIPYTYGGHNIAVPDDTGALMITYDLYPGTYQPSGHINVSRAREFYLRYISSQITSSYTGTLIVIASAINFLLISDGSAVLRYTT